jgi:15-cis-phytoene synthase
MTDNLKLAPDEPLIMPLTPHGVRGKIAVLWDVHDRLSALSMTGSEPALRQIRLAWWRDSLAALRAGAAPPAEPLLQAVAEQLLSDVAADALADLAEARLDLVGREWASDAVAAYGQTLFFLSAALLDEECAGGAVWAMTDVALRSPTGDARDDLLRAAAQSPVPRGGPRALYVLDRLAASIAQRGGERLRRREQLLVLRAGLFGR